MTGSGLGHGSEIVLLVGTMKGAFIFRSDASRKEWRMEGPHFRGESVYSLFHDVRGGRNRTFAAATNPHSGGTLRTLRDPSIRQRVNASPEMRRMMNDVINKMPADHRPEMRKLLASAGTVSAKKPARKPSPRKPAPKKPAVKDPHVGMDHSTMKK